MSRIAAFGLLVSIGVGCGDGTRDRLSNHDFVSESVEGFDLVEKTQLTLSFRDANLSASAGCNSFGGTYELRGNALVVTNMWSTGIGCLGALSDQEDWYEALLTGGPTLAIEEPRLTLMAPGAKVTFLDRKIAIPDAPLVGTAWIGNGFSNGMIASVGPGSAAVTLMLGNDGRVAAHTSCEAGTGTFTSDASTITFVGLTYDGAACVDPTFEATSAAARRVLDGAPVTYTIKERALTVTRGGESLLFHAAP